MVAETAEENTDQAPWQANNVPHSRTVTLPHHFGLPLKVSPPLIHQAAVLLFCTRMQRFPIGHTTPTPDDVVKMNDPIHRLGGLPFSPSHARTNYPSLTSSKTYDDDVLRLLSCHDATIPREPSEPRFRYVPGLLSGSWEGRFVVSLVSPLLGITHQVSSSLYTRYMGLMLIRTSWKAARRLWQN